VLYLKAVAALTVAVVAAFTLTWAVAVVPAIIASDNRLNAIVFIIVVF